MSTSIIPFSYADHPVRVIQINGEPWFVAADVAVPLGLTNIRSSLALLDKDEKGVHTMDTPSGAQQMATISEAGLYSLILRSRKPEAKAFKRWVTHEVLPAIRRTGRYGADAIAGQVPQTLPEALRAYAREIEAREALEAYAMELEPKADAYTAFIDGDGTYSVGTVAKMLGLSQNKLFAELRNAGVLIAKGAMRNTPYQQYMHHFAVKAYDYTRSDGTTATSHTTRVQPSGIDFIRRKIGVTTGVAS